MGTVEVSGRNNWAAAAVFSITIVPAASPESSYGACVVVSLALMCVCPATNASNLVKETLAHSQQNNKENKTRSVQRLWLDSWKHFIFLAKNGVGFVSALHGLN